MAFPFDIFQRLFEGDWIAWFAVALFIVCVGGITFLVILWWKLPGYAKAGFFNNLFTHHPVVLRAYENKQTRFHTPQMFANGLAYDGFGWFAPMKLWANAITDLKVAEQQVLNSVYSGEGCPAGLYLNYSIQAQIVNPELMLIVQHEQTLRKLKKGMRVKIDKELFKSALDHIKDKEIVLEPLYLDFPLDIRRLKTMMPQALPQSVLLELENKVREIMRKAAGLGGDKGTILLVLLVINLILGIVGVLKTFGVF